MLVLVLLHQLHLLLFFLLLLHCFITCIIVVLSLRVHLLLHILMEATSVVNKGRNHLLLVRCTADLVVLRTKSILSVDLFHAHRIRTCFRGSASSCTSQLSLVDNVLLLLVDWSLFHLSNRWIRCFDRLDASFTSCSVLELLEDLALHGCQFFGTTCCSSLLGHSIAIASVEDRRGLSARLLDMSSVARAGWISHLLLLTVYISLVSIID